MLRAGLVTLKPLALLAFSVSSCDHDAQQTGQMARLQPDRRARRGSYKKHVIEAVL